MSRPTGRTKDRDACAGTLRGGGEESGPQRETGQGKGQVNPPWGLNWRPASVTPWGSGGCAALGNWPHSDARDPSVLFTRLQVSHTWGVAWLGAGCCLASQVGGMSWKSFDWQKADYELSGKTAAGWQEQWWVKQSGWDPRSIHAF